MSNMEVNTEAGSTFTTVSMTYWLTVLLYVSGFKLVIVTFQVVAQVCRGCAQLQTIG